MLRQHSRQTHRRTPLLAAGLMMAMAACSSEPITTSPADGQHSILANAARIQLVVEIDPMSLILVDVHNMQLLEGEIGTSMRAQVVDANGTIVSGARATWRNLYDTVATMHTLADSADGARMQMHAVHEGVTLAIATYGDFADTVRIRVRAPGDTIITTPPPPPPPTARPTKFNATVYVRGFVATSDTGTTGTVLLPGSTVTLTRLPLVAGDSLPAGVEPVMTPTLFATVTVDENSRAVFRDVPQSRFRLHVTPPPGSTWQAGDITVPPPQIANYTRTVTLYKP